CRRKARHSSPVIFLLILGTSSVKDVERAVSATSCHGPPGPPRPRRLAPTRRRCVSSAQSRGLASSPRSAYSRAPSVADPARQARFVWGPALVPGRCHLSRGSAPAARRWGTGGDRHRRRRWCDPVPAGRLVAPPPAPPGPLPGGPCAGSALPV